MLLIEIAVVLVVHLGTCIGLDLLFKHEGFSDFVASILGVTFHYGKYMGENNCAVRWENCNTIAILVTTVLLFTQPVIYIVIQSFFYFYIDVEILNTIFMRITLLKIFYHSTVVFRGNRYIPLPPTDPGLYVELLVMTFLPYTGVYVGFYDLLENLLYISSYVSRLSTVKNRLLNADIFNNVENAVIFLKTKRYFFHVSYIVALFWFIVYIIIFDRNKNIGDTIFLYYSTYKLAESIWDFKTKYE